MKEKTTWANTNLKQSVSSFPPTTAQLCVLSVRKSECTLKSKDLGLIKKFYISDTLICKHLPCEQLLLLNFFF